MPDEPMNPGPPLSGPSVERWTTDELLYSILAPNAELQEWVGTKIGPVGAFESGDETDRIQYQQIGCSWDYDCDGRSLARARYQLTAWSKLHDTAARIAAAIVGILSDFERTAAMEAIFVEDQGDVLDLDADESMTWYGKYVIVTLVVKGY